MIETGVWAIMVLIGVAFTFFSLKTVDKASIAFHMIAIAMFIGLTALHAAQYGVASTSQEGNEIQYNSTGAVVLNVTHAPTTNTLIPEGTQGSWLQWVFLSLAVFNLFLIFRQVIRL